MPGKIFVNYRRDDVPGDARGIHDGLVGKFGKSNVFMDVDNLLAGQRFDKELDKALEACDVLVAVMGSRWMELQSERTVSGDRDYVREEIAAALKRDIVVIPVRVGHDGRMAPLPRRDELPEDIRDLVLHQKHDVAHERFRRDITDLCAAIATVRRNQRPPTPWRMIVAGVLVTVLLGGSVLANQVGFLPWPTATPVSTTPNTQAKDKIIEAESKRRTEVEASSALVTRAEERRLAAEARRKADEEQRQRFAAEAKRKADEAAARHDPALAVTPGSGQNFQDRQADGSPCPTCPKMVLAPSGTFWMGSTPSEIAALKKELGGDWYANEAPKHDVNIAKAFAVGKFPVTFDEWEACVADNGCNEYKPSDQGWGRANRPVINVNWNDAQAYIAWLSRKTGMNYRLMSEAEREYVTRAGTSTPFWWGPTISTIQANYDGNHIFAGSAKGEFRKKTLPVESFEANPWGVFQVHGNVYDWVEDCWHDTYQGAPTNGSAWTTSCTGGNRRVVRGGSWTIEPDSLLSANRGWFASNVRYNHVGFRVARSLTP